MEEEQENLEQSSDTKASNVDLPEQKVYSFDDSWLAIPTLEIEDIHDVGVDINPSTSSEVVPETTVVPETMVRRQSARLESEASELSF